MWCPVSERGGCLLWNVREAPLYLEFVSRPFKNHLRSFGVAVFDRDVAASRLLLVAVSALAYHRRCDTVCAVGRHATVNSLQSEVTAGGAGALAVLLANSRAGALSSPRHFRTALHCDLSTRRFRTALRSNADKSPTDDPLGDGSRAAPWPKA